jgi:hypothetical protein
MTVSRPPELRVGDEIVVDGATHTVAGLSGSQAQLVDVIGAESRIALADLLGAPGFRMVTRSAAPLPPQGLLDSLPADVAEQALGFAVQLDRVGDGGQSIVGHVVSPSGGLVGLTVPISAVHARDAQAELVGCRFGRPCRGRRRSQVRV